MTPNQDATQQLSQAAALLLQAAQDIQQNKTYYTKEDQNDIINDVLEQIASNLSTETYQIFTDALNQIQGHRPADAPNGQLYGWMDSLSQQLGTKPPAPTDEVRQLQEIISELRRKS